MALIKQLKKYAALYIGVIVIYMAALLLVYAIPNSAVAENVKISQEYLELEGDNPLYIFFSPASRTDNYSDKIIYEEVLKEDDHGILYNAMDNQDYARYWHGHSVYMRPLSVFFNILQIRYLLMAVFYGLVLLTLYNSYRRFGLRVAIPLAVGFLMIYPNTVSTCLQLAAIFLVTMIFSNIIIRTYDAKPERIGRIIFLCGSVANFFDLLTIPLLSFGMPLIFVLLMNKDAIKDQFLLMVRLGIAWVAGYGGTWAAKWIIGTVVLHRSVIADALNTVAYRIDGKEDWFDINYPNMYRSNITNILPPLPMALNIAILAALVVTAAVLLVRSSAARARMKELCLLPVAALAPYAWYTVVLNHSCIHAFFTYRLQLITLVALGVCFAEIICAYRKETAHESIDVANH